MPIGAILLHEQSVEDNCTKYLVIDGLQRATTLCEYSRQPATFYNSEKEDKGIENLVSVLSNFYQSDKDEAEQLKAVVIEWLKSIKVFSTTNGFSSNELLERIDTRLGKEPKLNKAYRDFVNKVNICLEDIKTDSDISDIKIPMIVFSGDASLLPDIFERLNSGGTKLSKFEVFAASWAKYVVRIENPDIKKSIRTRYSKIEKKGFSIDGFNANSDPSEYNFFEYLFGFSKYIIQKHPHLFSSKKDDETDSIGFYIATICAELELQKMHELPTKIPEDKLKDFEEHVLIAVKEAEKSLTGFLDIKVNKNKKSDQLFVCKILEYQIVSIIGYFFRILFDEKINDTKRRSRLKVLKENVPYHYLFDALRKNWSNAGDTKATKVYNERIYENTLAKEDWDSVLTTYFSNTKKKLIKDRAAVESDTILLFKYMYGSILSAKEQQADIRFEIEHLVPVGRMKGAAALEDQGLPINCLSNLCLLSKKLNQGKGELTIYEWYDKQVQDGAMTQDEANKELRNIERMTFTKRRDLDFVKLFDDPAKYDEAKNKYDEFLNKRFEILKKKFFELNKISKKG